MARVRLELSISVDGYVVGANPTLEQPLGEGGEQLHEWAVRLASWRERHGEAGGDAGPDDDRQRELAAANGAFIMGRRMFSGGEGPWEDDPNADGWWGDDPPFRVPVFVLTHHRRGPVVKQGGTTFTFVTEGIDSALEQALAAAGNRNVAIGGGANVAQQYLRAGLVDELQLHVAPVFLGDGVRLFDGIPPGRLDLTRAYDVGGVTHLEYGFGTSSTGGAS